MWYQCRRDCDLTFLTELKRDRHEAREHPRTATEYMTVLAYENVRLGSLRIKFEMQKLRFQEKEKEVMNRIDEIKKKVKESMVKANE